jgi:hypothetical protein
MNFRMEIARIWASFQRRSHYMDETDTESNKSLKEVILLGSMVSSAVASPVLVDVPPMWHLSVFLPSI